MTVSLSCRALGSMVGTIGAGSSTNLMGTPMSLWFRRTASESVVCPGSESPSRVASESWFRPSFFPRPFDSK